MAMERQVRLDMTAQSIDVSHVHQFNVQRKFG
jgi:hypothetical protein